MKVSFSQKFKILLTLIEKAIALATEKELKEKILLLETVKKFGLALKPDSGKLYKAAYKTLRYELSESISIVFGIGMSPDYLSKSIKEVKKEWNQSKDSQFNLEHFGEDVWSRINLEKVSSGSEVMKQSHRLITYPRRSVSAGSLPKHSNPEQLSKSKLSRSTTKKMLFFHPFSPKKKQNPDPFIADVENVVQVFFAEQFHSNSLKAKQFVISLIQNKEQFSWVIQTLNEASDSNQTMITEVLVNNLPPAEILDVFKELFKLEKLQNWGRGNQLLYTLIQHYLNTDEFKEFVGWLWESMFSLAGALDHIKIKQRASIPLKAASYAAEDEDIQILQDAFSAVLIKIFSPKHYPLLMQQIMKLAYTDLIDRSDLNTEEHYIHTRMVLQFIILRFINPILLANAKICLTHEHLCKIGMLNTQVDDQQGSKATIQMLQTWYTRSLIAALQSFAAPIVEPYNPPIQITGCIEKQLEDTSLHEEILGVVLNNVELKNTVLEQIQTELAFAEIKIEQPTFDDAQIAVFDLSETMFQLRELLEEEQFSDLEVNLKQDAPANKTSGKSKSFSIFTSVHHPEKENKRFSTDLSPFYKSSGPG